jgi:hypothetical protein
MLPRLPFPAPARHVISNARLRRGYFNRTLNRRRAGLPGGLLASPGGLLSGDRQEHGEADKSRGDLDSYNFGLKY